MPESKQQKLIRAATLKAVKSRDLYANKITADLTKSLASAQQEVANAILRYKTLGSLPDNKLAAMTGLQKLNAEIDEIGKTLQQEHTLLMKNAAKNGFQKGIFNGISEFADAQFPGYKDLTPDGIDKLATKAFSLVDTDALDFMTEYNLVLAGDVDREVLDGIKRTMLSGITTGKSTDDIVRDLGRVVVDKESFRQAGTRVFPNAQYRMEMIARTEVLRAHNMGRLKFHERVGVQRLEWVALEDERMCPVCGGLDGKTFPIDKFPQQPAHPMCRCTNVVVFSISSDGEYGFVGEDLSILSPKEIMRNDVRKKLSKTGFLIDNRNFPEMRKCQNKVFNSLIKAKVLKKDVEFGEFERIITKNLNNLLRENDTIYSRTTIDGFLSILDDWQFKTQHETGTSMGLLDSEVRKLVEKNLFNYNLSMENELRPVYGYMHPKKSATINDKTKALDWYGDISIRIKDSVKDRTTFTYLDSLSIGKNKRAIPSSILNPKYESIDFGYIDISQISLNKVEYPKYSYIEAQIHGGLDIDDIDSVVLIQYSNSNNYTLKKHGEIIEKLKEKSIDYSVEIDGNEDKIL